MVPSTEETATRGIGNLKTDKPQASQTKNKNPISNLSNKDMALNKLTSLDISRSFSRTETEYTVKPKKTRLISSASLDDKDTREQQPK